MPQSTLDGGPAERGSIDLKTKILSAAENKFEACGSFSASKQAVAAYPKYAIHTLPRRQNFLSLCVRHVALGMVC